MLEILQTIALLCQTHIAMTGYANSALQRLEDTRKMQAICQLELMECIDKADPGSVSGASTVLYKCNKTRVMREGK